MPIDRPRRQHPIGNTSRSAASTAGTHPAWPAAWAAVMGMTAADREHIPIHRRLFAFRLLMSAVRSGTHPDRLPARSAVAGSAVGGHIVLAEIAEIVQAEIAEIAEVPFCVTWCMAVPFAAHA